MENGRLRGYRTRWIPVSVHQVEGKGSYISVSSKSFPHTRHKVHERLGIAVQEHNDVAFEMRKADVDTPYVSLVRVISDDTNRFGKIVRTGIL
jgi:hypothetical protein